jgi:murein L,D-transpeptidase YcbB/YkuD
MTSRTIQVLLCIAIIAAGCERVPPADRDAALETVRRNVRLLQEKKVDEMMTTIHPQSPAFAPTRTSITELMKEFDLKCELTLLKVEGARKGDLRVRFEQITQRIKAGVAEPRTKMSGVHVLRKDGEAWKIFDTEVIAADLIDPLPEDPEPVDENVAAP